MEQPSLRHLTNPKFGKPPESQNFLLQQLGQPHLTSFNYMVNTGLDKAIQNLTPVKFELSNGDRVCLNIEEASISYPCVANTLIGVKERRMFPTECRQSSSTYKGKLMVKVSWSVNGSYNTLEKDMGDIPIMVKSNRCHLELMNPSNLVAHGEHEQEWGGCFVVKGYERLVRMLLLTRRNYPIAIKRSGWKMRGALFSDIGVFIRCATEDQTSTNNVLHFVTDGSAKLMFSHRRVLYYAPLVLVMKCLCNHSDQYMYKKIMEGFEGDLYFSECVQNMLRNVHEQGLHTHEQCKAYLGKMFRVKMYDCPSWFTDIEIAEHILKYSVLIHLHNAEDKFNLLVFMTQKLYAFAGNKCVVEGADAVMMQELLLGGHLYLQILKDRLQSWLAGLRINILKRDRSSGSPTITAGDMMKLAKITGTIENRMESFLSSGNVPNSSNLNIPQDKGLTILAENINRMRYMSHFKAVHRGAFFVEMRTTEARQLLPDAWGFICPVHTPDGSPCGLLNHLTMHCFVTDIPDRNKVDNIPSVLLELGMLPVKNNIGENLKEHYVVQLDGRVLGYVHDTLAFKLADQLRSLKIKGDEVPHSLEIVLVPKKKGRAQFPGFFLFTGPARMMRPLINLKENNVEYVGTFEQIYMEICTVPKEMYAGVTTHMEMSKSAFLSNLACLIPMPDCNQSPRNMYQCQMGKQTMGTPCHNWNLQTDSKLYRLQTPASPLFRPVHYDNISLDDFAMGTNAIVAVISYTGYDMEDAMIINKSSYERGFAHGSIQKTEVIELEVQGSYFCRDPEKADLAEKLDTDGLPHPGTKLVDGDPLYCYYSPDESRYVVKKYYSKEDCFVDQVRLCGSARGERTKRFASLSFRIPRNPSVGDKFASRAGQKGICSQKWPSEDLPFTETGLVPDIVFNPHGFPSRMTIAMMIELMAGKTAAVHGLVHDASPFKFTEEDTAIDYFGRLLEAGGYNYHGTETMYSGVDGREMTAQIFFGIVHYQRLRHMVSDKWQVRSTGAMDALTRQPVGGRKRGGGVRFGEMERDSLISHGASFLLQDRLLHCSDKTRAFICTSCGSLLGPVTQILRVADQPNLTETKETCRLCGHGNNIEEVEIPYIFKFFIAQLASVNINVKISCKNS